ncbi:hypothetical protein CGRA01v4_11861 [Colletotrichum graminicola]|nr:hypothetical protein CGRA01v4_11861 [Colletotrichum graminicola]
MPVESTTESWPNTTFRTSTTPIQGFLRLGSHICLSLSNRFPPAATAGLILVQGTPTQRPLTPYIQDTHLQPLSHYPTGFRPCRAFFFGYKRAPIPPNVIRSPSHLYKVRFSCRLDHKTHRLLYHIPRTPDAGPATTRQRQHQHQPQSAVAVSRCIYFSDKPAPYTKALQSLTRPMQPHQVYRL